MFLTSLQNYKTFYKVSKSDQDQNLSATIAAVSSRFEKYLKRHIKYTQYTEQFSPTLEQTRFKLSAYPVASIVSVAVDSTGLFAGAETVLAASSYILDTDDKTLVIATYPALNDPFRGLSVTPKSIRIIYNGGIAPHATKSVFTLADIVEDVEDDSEISVSDSVAGEYGKGVITAVDGLDITVETEYGTFEEGETLTVGLKSATLEEVVSQSLVELEPELVMACNFQVNFYNDHKSDFENASTESGSVTRRGPTDGALFLPEVIQLLEPYRNKQIDRL